VSEQAGRLEDTPLPSLLQQLLVDKATGVLKLETRSGTNEVFERAGYPVAVYLPGAAELLGKVLVEMGILDEATHKRTLAAPPPKGQRYGDQLLAEGLVTPDQMRLALKAQVRRKLHRLFFLNEGAFSFVPGEHQEGLHGKDSLRVHPHRAIYHGVRSAWSAERLREALFLLEGRAIKCVLDVEAVARYGVGTDDGRITELLRRGHWVVPDLVDAVGLPVQPVHALVYALYITEALDVRGADEVARLRKRTAGAEPSGALPLPTQTSPQKPPTQTSGPHKLPTQTSGPHKLPTPGGSGLHKLPTEGSGPHKMQRSPSGSFLSPQPTTGRRLVAPEAIDPETMRKQIQVKAAAVESESLFAVLGLQPTAGREEVKNAYFDAAKRYHPDRLVSLGLEALRPDVEKIFRRVSEAYGTLYDDDRRAEYVATLGSSTAKDAEAHAKAMKMLDAEMAFKRGEILLRKNDYLGAIRELEQAVAGNPQEGEHLAFLTWARVCAQQTTFADAKPLFLEATRLSPQCARAFYYLGLCLKEDKEIDRAYNMFRKAHDLDPRMLDAEREMRLINMRKEKVEKKGFFDRFRKPH
jgi:curved DNA-binding protein CbpA